MVQALPRGSRYHGGVAAARQVVANGDRELTVYAQKLAAAQEALGRRPPPDGEDLHR